MCRRSFLGRRPHPFWLKSETDVLEHLDHGGGVGAPAPTSCQQDCWGASFQWLPQRHSSVPLLLPMATLMIVDAAGTPALALAPQVMESSQSATEQKLDTYWYWYVIRAGNPTSGEKAPPPLYGSW